MGGIFVRVGDAELTGPFVVGERSILPLALLTPPLLLLQLLPHIIPVKNHPRPIRTIPNHALRNLNIRISLNRLSSEPGPAPPTQHVLLLFIDNFLQIALHHAFHDVFLDFLGLGLVRADVDQGVVLRHALLFELDFLEDHARGGLFGGAVLVVREELRHEELAVFAGVGGEFLRVELPIPLLLSKTLPKNLIKLPHLLLGAGIDKRILIVWLDKPSRDFRLLLILDVIIHAFLGHFSLSERRKVRFRVRFRGLRVRAVAVGHLGGGKGDWRGRFVMVEDGRWAALSFIHFSCGFFCLLDNRWGSRHVFSEVLKHHLLLMREPLFPLLHLLLDLRKLHKVRRECSIHKSGLIPC